MKEVYKKILVVDGDQMILEFMKEILSKEGHQVITAEDGGNALDILKTYTPEVLFIDLVVPGIDGKKLCKVIRGMQRLRGSYLIILSATLIEEPISIAELGANACVAKGPFDQMARSILWVLDQPDLATSRCLSGEVIGSENIYPRIATKQLLSVKRHFEVILERISEGILEITSHGTILYANPLALSLISIPEEKLLGSLFVELFAGDDRHRVSELIKAGDDKPKRIIENSPVDLYGHKVGLTILPLNGDRFTSIIVINDITEQERAKEALQASEASFRTMIQENSDGIIITDRDGIIHFVNPAGKDLLALKEEELVGEPFGFPMVAGETAELDINKRDGKRSVVEMRMVEIMWEGKNAYLASLRDMTEIYEARKNVELLAGLVENAKYVMIFIVSLDGRIMQCNALAGSTLGYSKKEMLAMEIVALLKPKADEGWKRIADSVQSKTYWRGELLAMCKDGREFPVDMASSGSVDERDEKINIICFIRDVSREKEVDRMKSEFISVVGHELRTPLTSIKSALDIVLGKTAGAINDDQKRFLSTADRNVGRLSGIISELLDVSKIESGTIKIELEPFDLFTPLDMAIGSLIYRAKEKSISIHKEIPSNLPQAYGDLDKLEQIFINLIDNAIKFTPQGGHINVSAKGYEPSGDLMEISVADTGTGISPDNLENVFDRFYQIEESLSREANGTGLGLSIVKGLVEALGGQIWVESEVGKGSKFIFILPIYSPGRTFKDCLNREIQRAKEKDTLLSLIMLKIEEFDYLSKTYGEEEALKLMDKVRRLVQETVRRTTDIIQIQTTGRVIMVLSDTPKEGAYALDNRLKEMLSKQTFKVNKSVKINLTSVVATYPEDGLTADELMKKARGLMIDY